MAGENSCISALKGIAMDCATSMGGVKEVYLANKEDIQEITELEGKITEITMKEMAKFKKYAFRNGVSNMVSNWQIDPLSNTKYVQTDLMMSFNRMETAKRIEINTLIKTDAVAIVLDNNKKYWFLGKDEPVVATAGDGNTGTARGDKNGYTITLQDNSLELPIEVDGGIVSALVG